MHKKLLQPPLCRILDGPLQPPPPEFGRVWRACNEVWGNACSTQIDPIYRLFYSSLYSYPFFSVKHFFISVYRSVIPMASSIKFSNIHSILLIQNPTSYYIR